MANVNLSGTIPASWSYFSSGSIDLSGTSIGGCMPDGLQMVIRTSGSNPLPSCKGLTAADEVAALLDVKALLNRAGPNSIAGLSTWANGEGKAVTAELMGASNAVTRRYG